MPVIFTESATISLTVIFTEPTLPLNVVAVMVADPNLSAEICPPFTCTTLGSLDSQVTLVLQAFDGLTDALTVLVSPIPRDDFDALTETFDGKVSR